MRDLREQQIQDLLDDLAEFYSADEADEWIRSPHKLLGGDKAIDLLGTDRAREVFAIIDGLRSGSYL